jgi:hypothetical protein
MEQSPKQITFSVIKGAVTATTTGLEVGLKW